MQIILQKIKNIFNKILNPGDHILSVESEHEHRRYDSGVSKSLVNCFSHVTGFFGEHISPTVFLAGLSHPKEGIDLKGFVDGVKQFKYLIRAVQRDLESLRLLDTPCIAKLKSEGWVVFRQVGDSLVEIYFPQTGKIKRVNFEKVLEDFAGQVYLLRPKQEIPYDKKSLETKQAWFWEPLKLYSGVLWEIIIITFVVNLFMFIGALFAFSIYDRVVPHRAFETLWALSIGIMMMYIFDFFLRNLRGHFINLINKNTDVAMSSYLFGKVLRMRLGMPGVTVGAMMHRVNEYRLIRDFFGSSAFLALVDFPFLVLFIAGIAYISPTVSWVPIIVIFLSLGASWSMQRPISKAISKMFGVASKNESIMYDTTHSLEVIKASNAEARTQYSLEQIVDTQSTQISKVNALIFKSQNVALMLQNFVYLLVVIVAVYEVALSRLTVGGMIACTILASRASASSNVLIGLLVHFSQARQALETLDSVAHLNSEIPEGRSFVKPKKFKGDITLQNLSFSFPQESTKALNNINLSIKAGEKIAILGRIGSGKTTLTKLLLGLYEPQEGMVSMDKLDMRQLHPADYRALMGFVPQTPMLKMGTVRENILLGAPEASDEDIIQSIQLACVDAFINGHPKGFDMEVARGASNLSMGQQQSLSLARAIIQDPRIVIMDEPTANMDPQTEMQVIGNLKGWLGDRTFIVVTHRHNVLQLVDRIIVMDQGKVVADGPRDQILQLIKQGGNG